MLHKNQIEQATITAMSSDGNGIAKIDGMVVFVPYTAVGDQLQVRIAKVQKNFAFGIIDKLLQPSPDRVEDRCPVYKKCGGCAFRHISYEAELRHKAQFVEDNLRRIGGLEPKMLPITPSPLQQGYRNKAQYPIREEDGEIVAGFLPSAATGLSPARGVICSRPFLSRFWSIPSASRASTASPPTMKKAAEGFCAISICGTVSSRGR